MVLTDVMGVVIFAGLGLLVIEAVTLFALQQRRQETSRIIEQIHKDWAKLDLQGSGILRITSLVYAEQMRLRKQRQRVAAYRDIHAERMARLGRRAKRVRRGGRSRYGDHAL